jgi:hypothetical protein
MGGSRRRVDFSLFSDDQWPGAPGRMAARAGPDEDMIITFLMMADRLSTTIRSDYRLAGRGLLSSARGGC